MTCSVGHRLDSDLLLLWLWHRQAAVALIQPLAWKLPHASQEGGAEAALERPKKKKKNYKLCLVPSIKSLADNLINSCYLLSFFPLGLGQFKTLQ